MQPFPKKENAPDLSEGAVRKAYVHETQDSKDLFQKELDVNQAEQNLLRKRIEMMNKFINDLPASDPQYNMMRRQVEMDQIEIDELKIRSALLVEKLSQ